jgi:hypothetical protein
MIIRNILILCLASTASSFLVAPPLVRSSPSYASTSVRVSLSDSGSETENSEVGATANENESSDASSDVGEALPVSAEATDEEPEEKKPATDEDPEEKKPSAGTERHTIYVGNLPYCKQKAVKSVCDFGTQVHVGRKSNINSSLS